MGRARALQKSSAARRYTAIPGVDHFVAGKHGLIKLQHEFVVFTVSIKNTTVNVTVVRCSGTSIVDVLSTGINCGDVCDRKSAVGESLT